MGVHVILATDLLLDQVVLTLVAEDNVDLGENAIIRNWVTPKREG